MGALDETSHDIGVLRGKVDMLIEMHAQTSARHLDMHKDTHEKMDKLISSIDGKFNAHDKRLTGVEHKITYQRGVIATLSVAASLVGAWASKVIQNLFS